MAGNYTCIKTNGAGSVTSNVITVTANSIPATVQANPGPIVCGEAVWLINTGMSGTYQWKLNGNNISGATAFNYSPTVSGSYYCVVTNPCGSFTSNIINVSINPPMPAATITAAGPTIICNGQATLNANTAAGLTYQWYTRNDWNATTAIVPGATGSSFIASTDGNYFVIEKNASGCTQTSNAIVVLIGTPPVPNVEPLSASICNGNNIPLHVLYFNPLLGYSTPPYSYQWTKNGQDIAGATTYYYMAGQQGTYTVRASASGGCNSVSPLMIVTNGCNARTTSSASKEPEKSVLNESDFKIVPNPVSSQAQITFNVIKPGKVLLNVFAMDGKLINIIADRNFEAGTYQLTIDTKNLKVGIYILKLQSKGFLQTTKLIVTK